MAEFEANGALVLALEHALRPQLAVELALLFGSRARGSARVSSDVDVALLAPGADLLEIGALLSRATRQEVDLLSLEVRASRCWTSSYATRFRCSKGGPASTLHGARVCSLISSSIGRGTNAYATPGSTTSRGTACDGQPQPAFVEAR
jgi:predicted nucleotidyltransferase